MSLRREHLKAVHIWLASGYKLGVRTSAGREKTKAKVHKPNG